MLVDVASAAGASLDGAVSDGVSEDVFGAEAVAAAGTGAGAGVDGAAAAAGAAFG